jgi:hypothetical protein
MIIPQTRLPGFMLGKNARQFDNRNLLFSKYVPSVVPPPIPDPPRKLGYIDKVPSWPMLLNNSLGCCVEAAQLHMIQQWTTYAGTPVTPLDADCVRLYEAEGGYVSGDPNTDNGTDMLTALKYWRNTGVTVGGIIHKILGFVAVDWTNPIEIKQAIMLFGNVFVGAGLPISAQTPPMGANGLPMFVVPKTIGATRDGSPGSWGGHCFPTMDFSKGEQGDGGYEDITWGGVYDMSKGFVTSYVDEMYAVLSEDWIETTGLSPSQFNLAQLKADLAAL